MTSCTRTIRRLAVVLACLVAACSEVTPPPPPPPPPPAPTPGVVDLFLSRAGPNDKAALITVHAPMPGFAPASDVETFVDAGADSTRLIIIASGRLSETNDLRYGKHIGSFTIPDTSMIARLTASVREVARESYGLADSLLLNLQQVRFVKK
jgi:hypothetical protein